MRSSSAPARHYRAPALEKGLDILEVLADARAPLSQVDLVERLGRTQGEIFRMLNCLESRGYIVRESKGGRYRLTLRLYELGHKQNATSMLRNACRIPMETLAEESGQACHLSVPSGSSILILMERMPPRRICLAVGEGTVIPMHDATSGRLLLSQLPAADAHSVLADDANFRAKPDREQQRILGSLTKLRKAGYVLSKSIVTQGVHDVAAIVGIPGTDTLAALVMSFLPGPRKRDRTGAIYLQLLRDCAAKVNRNLGMTG